jgi:hypothetical protein
MAVKKDQIKFIPSIKVIASYSEQPPYAVSFEEALHGGEVLPGLAVRLGDILK